MPAGKRIAAIAATIVATAAVAPAPERCHNATGVHDGFFYTFWKNGGDACVTLEYGGRYASRFDLDPGENLVVGKGWRKGSSSRTVGYLATRFEPGRNGYLALYGWSVDPLVEYYVVENWGSAFTPPGGDAVALGTVTSDGGTYRIFRTMRVEQPSIRGVRTFDQYWSVRTSRRPVGGAARITFANHVRAWRTHGLRLGTLDYQVLATEGFGSTGGSDVTVGSR